MEIANIHKNLACIRQIFKPRTAYAWVFILLRFLRYYREVLNVKKIMILFSWMLPGHE